MLPLIVKVIGSIFLAISSLIIAKNLLKSDEKIITKENIILIIPIVLVTCIMYSPQYSSLLTLTIYMILILTIRKILSTNLSVSIILSTISLLIFAVVDVLLSSLETVLFNYETLRNVWYINIFNNIFICLTSIGISKIKKVSVPFGKLCAKVDKKSYEEIFFGVTIIIVMTLFYYNITNIFELNIAYIITLISMFIFIILYYFYAIEKSNYERLNEEYKILLNCVQTFEDWIDNEQMYKHELKNSLSVIRNMTNNKNIIKKIDKILGVNISIDDEYIENLKYIPKNSMKGLIYYKIALAQKNKVEMVIEVSPNVVDSFKKISEEKINTICIILGIYLDNAIEEAQLTNEKKVTIEIYVIEQSLNIVISNSCRKVISLKEMSKKNFSTKGNNHGNGLYYVGKMLRKNKWLKSNSLFLNNYFIQKIIIK